ncbi:hypothetical protein KCP75_18085 [Salmonella enterica subsp. enterica]|nr:hypothetical protein KCP75_18085 [Salmonella enterica subsp. enterica]
MVWILPKAVLDMPRLGCINVHGSLLPRWRRGAYSALTSGQAMRNRRHNYADGCGLDTGDMLYKLACPDTG